MTEAQRAVVTAARACFARYGVQRTRMEDIAREANMVRQTLYAFVTSRDELIELALIDWCRDLEARIDDDRRPHPDDPAEDLVEFLAQAIEITRADAEFTALAEAISRVRVTELLTGATPVHDIVVRSLHPALARAADAGLLRADVSEDEITAWLSNVLAVLVSRSDLDAEALRDLLRKFAVRSILE